jgi:serine carboxypeptidase-like clade II
MFVSLATLFVAAIAAAAAAAASFPGQQFQVTSLPGLASFPTDFGVYSGYITVDATAGRALFFMFAEASEVRASAAPLVVWFTGGPGCSSLMALFQENGPFAVNSPGVVTANAWSWNRRANVLWIESPAGVGFSYSNDTADYAVGDARTTADATVFLQRFLFDYFPQYARAPVWFTGESYGGHYVPLATWAAYGTRASARPIDVRGMMVGNAWTDAANDNQGCLDQWWTHALIDQASADAVSAACNLSAIGPLVTAARSCSQAVSHVQSVAFLDINIYDIYADECNVNAAAYADHVVRKLADAGSAAHQILAGAKKKHARHSKRQMDPCDANNLAPYLNDPNVQAAINALPTQWSACSSVVDYDRTSILTSVLPVYAKLFAAKLHVLIYSGDVDGIVPVLGTLKNVAALNRPIKTHWQNWFVADQYGAQVGGFTVQHDTFTFATVRNAGHMVPQYQPRRAYYMFANFLANQTLPTSNPFN